MKRISSLLVASGLAILPISAFAQQTATPGKAAAEPTGMTTAPPNVTAPVSGDKTATSATTHMAKPVKPDAKTPAAGTKGEVHGSNTINPHNTKTTAPAKTAEPTKS
jgi:hypothetical protein